MTTLPLPPVPQVLRELLKDYPEHIQTLQDDLVRLASNPYKGTPLFEQAVWTMEDGLSAFAADAQGKVNTAEAAGDSEAFAQAKKEASLMRRARKSGAWLMDEDFATYFHAPEFERISQ